jgi:hypothetical protein
VAEASKRSVLSVLTKGRLEDLGREFGVPVPSTAAKDAQVAVLADSALDLPVRTGRTGCRAKGRLCRSGSGSTDATLTGGQPSIAGGCVQDQVTHRITS